MKKLAFLALAAAAAASAPALAQDNFYSIKAGDVLNVRVLEDPNLSSQVLVRPDGRISLPIAGSVMAEGRSPERLEAVLRQRLSAGFELTPTVTVSVASVAVKRPDEVEEPETITYYVFGQISRPGPITVEEEKALTLLQVLAVAGGTGPFADGERVQLRRKGEDGVQQVILFNYDDLEDGLPVEDVELMDGDVIFVPERSLF